MRLLYGIYCKKHFEECKFRFVWDKKILYQMFSFAGWNFTGAASAILSSSGVNLLLNVFFGPIVNAARGISNSVNGAVSSFVNSFMTALNPQITKAYAEKDFEYLFKVIYRGTKFSFFLLYILSLPILLNTEVILKLWLVQIPPDAVVFVRLALLCSMIDCLSNPIVTLVLATGNIKKYSIVVGTLNILVFPICWILLKLNFAAYFVYVVTIVISISALVARVIMISKITNFSKKEFVTKVILRLIIVIIPSALLSVFCYVLISNNCHYLVTFFVSSFVAVIIILLSIYFIGLKKEERELILSKFNKKTKVEKIGE